MELTVQGAATLQCQRCMRSMSVPVDRLVKVALVASEAEVARAPAELEPVLASGGRISIGELITEELLLTLPIVALHGADEPCAAPAETPPEPPGAAFSPLLCFATGGPPPAAPHCQAPRGFNNPAPSSTISH